MENKQILQLITPSWLSAFIGGVIAIFGTSAGVIISRFRGSALQQQIFENQANSARSTDITAYDTITANVAANSFLNRLPLLLLWAAAGAIVYFFAVTIARSFGEAAEFRDHLGYVHTSRQAMIRQSMIHLLVRVAAVIGWFVLIKLTLSIFVPYALATASLGARSISITNIGFIILSVIILFVTAQLHAVMLRLIALRPRIFPG